MEFATDSGASETVAPEDILTSMDLAEGDAQKEGVRYEVADGTLIRNLGDRSYVAMSEEGSLRNMKVQVCDVNQPLLSVRRVTQAGNRVVFEEHGGSIEYINTGERMWMKLTDGMFLLKLWVKTGGRMPQATDFSRQG